MTEQPDTDEHETDEHPGIDRVADLHAGVLTGADAAAVEVHVDSCPDCRDHVQALEQVTATLASAPAVGPLPEDVRLRLDTALAMTAADLVGAESEHDSTDKTRATDAVPTTRTPSPTVVPLQHSDRRRSSRASGPRGVRVLQAAAAAVLVLGVGAVGYGALSSTVRTGGDSASSNGAATGGEESRPTAAAATFPLTASGRDWSATGVRSAVPRLVAGSLVTPLVAGSLVTPLAATDLVSPSTTKGSADAPSAAAAPGAATTTPGSGGSSASPGSSSDPRVGAESSEVVVPASRLAGGPALAACVQALVADAATAAGPVGTVTPLAVDLARWQQQPAAVILLPAVDEPGRVELWVVGEDCGAGDAKVLYFADVAR